MNPHRFLIPFVSTSLVIILLAACAPKPTATPDPKQALIGTWTSTVTKEDILRVMPGFDKQSLCENSGTFVWKFNADNSFTIDQTALPGCPALSNPHIEDKWTVADNLLTLASGTPDQEIYEFGITNDQLTFKAKESQCIPCIAVNTANPWKQVK